MSLLNTTKQVLNKRTPYGEPCSSWEAIPVSSDTPFVSARELAEQEALRQQKMAADFAKAVQAVNAQTKRKQPVR
jgi:hypothetical protein